MARPKNYVRKDERDPGEVRTHHVLIVGVDTFMSGWGGARGGLSVAAWACREEDADRVWAWVKSRSDMRRVKRAEDRGGCEYQPPASTRHFHIYVVREGHVALQPQAAQG